MWFGLFFLTFTMAFQFSSIQSLSRVWLLVTPWIAARLASQASPTPGVHSNSCSLNQWCHPTISSSLVPFSSPLQSFPAWGSFQMSQLFASSGQSIAVCVSTSILPMNIQDWFPLGWTGWISLQSKGFSRVYSNTVELELVYLNSLFCSIDLHVSEKTF